MDRGSSWRETPEQAKRFRARNGKGQLCSKHRSSRELRLSLLARARQTRRAQQRESKRQPQFECLSCRVITFCSSGAFINRVSVAFYAVISIDLAKFPLSIAGVTSVVLREPFSNKKSSRRFQTQSR